MNEQKCKNCRKLLPLTLTFFEADPSMASGLRSSCRKCRNESKRKGWQANNPKASERASNVDPHLPVMVGAAMRMWRGPVNREQPMRWAA